MEWVLLVVMASGKRLEVPIGVAMYATQTECYRRENVPNLRNYLADCLTVKEALEKYPDIHWL